MERVTENANSPSLGIAVPLPQPQLNPAIGLLGKQGPLFLTLEEEHALTLAAAVYSS